MTAFCPFAIILPGLNMSREGANVVDEKLLAILACPVCHAALRAEEDALVCTKTQVRYPVEEGIPILLAERAQPAHPAEVGADARDGHERQPGERSPGL